MCNYSELSDVLAVCSAVTVLMGLPVCNCVVIRCILVTCVCVTVLSYQMSWFPVLLMTAALKDLTLKAACHWGVNLILRIALSSAVTVFS